MTTLVRQAPTADEMKWERWWYEQCSFYIQPWYRKPAWFAHWFVMWMAGRRH